ncbi:sporulation integral membrane protein YtvI [Beduinella massiliensis]|uniref:sporulation integral membrane protein YtvI n=1 Tax=Beduinella massiliensis TaxID=1852363 RepID=UPI000C844DEA
MNEEKKKIYLRVLLDVALTLAAIGLLYLGGPLALEIMTPFILAFIMAWAFNPVVRGLQRKLGATRKVYSFIMVILFYALLGFLIVMFGKVLISQVIGLARSLPSILSQMQDTYQQLMEQLRMVMEKVPDQYAEIEAELFTAIDTAWQWFKGALSTLLSRAVSWTSNAAMRLPEQFIFLTVLVLASCFITADYPDLRDHIKNGMTPSTRRSLRLLRTSIKTAVGGFFRSQLIFAIADMSIILTFFFFMKVSYPLPIALVLAFLDFIPFFGAGTVIVPWGVIALIVGRYNMGLQLLILYGILYTLRRIFEPRVLGGQVGFSSLSMLFWMFAGMKVAGVTGLVVAPIVGIAVTNFWRTGIFDGFRQDLRVIVADVRSIIARPLPPEDPPRPGRKNKK